MHRSRLRPLLLMHINAMAALPRCSPSINRTRLQLPPTLAVASAGARPLCVARLSTIRCAANGVKASQQAPETDVRLPPSVPVRVAHELLQAGHHYLDVRTEQEFSAGHPVGAVNIPYMFRVGSGMTRNANFVEQVSSTFGKDDEIIVGCQSGKRSLIASAELVSSGFTAIADISGGYSAWMQNGFPIQK